MHKKHELSVRTQDATRRLTATKSALSLLIVFFFSCSLFSQVVPPGFYVDGWDHPFGNGGYEADGVTEYNYTQDVTLDPEGTMPVTSNPYYPSNPVANPKIMCYINCGENDGWSNKGGTGEFRENSGCHTGDDLNKGYGTEDAGEEIKMPAHGQVAAIFPVNNAGPTDFGWAVVTKHYYTNGEVYTFVAKHVTTAANISGAICANATDFTVAVGDWVERGEVIARIATGFDDPDNDTHLHMEIRNAELDFPLNGTKSELYPRDNGLQGYGGLYDCIVPCNDIEGGSGIHGATMSATEVELAYLNMQRDGIVSPMDYISQNRPSMFEFAPPPCDLTSGDAFSINWQMVVGGNGADVINDVVYIPGSGYLLIGYSESSSGYDKLSPDYGNADFWVVKTDECGEIEWENSYGGAGGDIAYAATSTSDGGYVIVGESASNISGTKLTNSYGSIDYWIVKINSSSDEVWQYTIGGSSNDYAFDVLELPSGDIVIGGYSSSGVSGNKTAASNGSIDYFIVSLSSVGNLNWQKSFGGSSSDPFEDMLLLNNGNILLSGYSYSGASGNKTEINYGFTDRWLVCIDATGTIVWQNSIGAAKYDSGGPALQTSDGYIYIGSNSNSNIGIDKTENCFGPFGGSQDVWILKLDSEDGTIIWDKTIGGNENDKPISITETSAGNIAVLASTSSTISGNKTTSLYGAEDAWLITLDNLGNILSQNEFGGTSTESPASIIKTGTGNLLLGIYSDSNTSGNKTSDKIGGGVYGDYWIVNLFGESACTPTTETCNGIDDDCDGLVDDGVVVTSTISAGGPTTFCSGGNVALSVTHTGTSVQWYKNGIIIPGQTSSTYTANASGTYSCTASSACGIGISGNIVVTVNKKPNATISAAGPTTFCAGGSVVLNVAPVGGSTYQWYKGASAIAGATGLSYTATTSGNYKCQVTKIATGCFKNSSSIAVSVTCREGELVSGGVLLYPNPANSTLSIDMSEVLTSGYTLSIYMRSASGQVVYSATTGDNMHTIDVSAYASGLYLVEIVGSNVRHTEMVVVE